MCQKIGVPCVSTFRPPLPTAKEIQPGESGVEAHRKPASRTHWCSGLNWRPEVEAHRKSAPRTLRYSGLKLAAGGGSPRKISVSNAPVRRTQIGESGVKASRKSAPRTLWYSGLKLVSQGCEPTENQRLERSGTPDSNWRPEVEAHRKSASRTLRCSGLNWRPEVEAPGKSAPRTFRHSGLKLASQGCEPPENDRGFRKRYMVKGKMGIFPFFKSFLKNLTILLLINFLIMVKYDSKS